VKSIRGLGCICGRGNIVKGEIELLLLGVDFKQLCAGFYLDLKQGPDYMKWRIVEATMHAVRMGLPVS